MRLAGLVLVGFAGLALASGPPPGDGDEPPSRTCRPCRKNAQLVAPCYTIRGRMNIWNGTPNLRIWPVGTNRILGVTGGPHNDEERTDCDVPENLAGKLSSDTSLFGDFLVCPFTEDKPGVMRFVCVESASHLVVRPRTKP
jgi:hypothetical protein